MDKCECCICHKKIENINKVENYICDECYEKYVRKILVKGSE